MAFSLTIAAIVYSVALIAWALAFTSVGDRTLLEYGGPVSMAIVVQPLVVSLAVWALLRKRCISGSRAATVAAWAAVVVYLVWSVLGALTLAAGALPAALLLLWATAATPCAVRRDA